MQVAPPIPPTTIATADSENVTFILGGVFSNQYTSIYCFLFSLQASLISTLPLKNLNCLYFNVTKPCHCKESTLNVVLEIYLLLKGFRLVNSKVPVHHFIKSIL